MYSFKQLFNISTQTINSSEMNERMSRVEQRLIKISERQDSQTQEIQNVKIYGDQNLAGLKE